MRIALIGNYAPDRQESMLRYAQLLGSGLAESGHDVTVVAPRPVLNRRGRPAAGTAGIWKWVGYLDKYCVGVTELQSAVRAADIVHICDHSNANYVPQNPTRPYVVTCHDLLAVRAALGEHTDCPASFLGRRLQQSILRGLKRAHAIACVSAATLRDARRVLDGYAGSLLVTPNALNHPYRRLSPDVVQRRLAAVGAFQDGAPYVLHVGSNERRKNRECVMRAVAEIAAEWAGRVVFAGRALTAELKQLAASLGIERRVVEIVEPDNELLEALYNGALALLFPSRFEGFGWPIAEAQASGCAVVCSNREPLPEVAGGAAIMCDADDAAAFGRAVIELACAPSRRTELVARGLANAERYAKPAMIGQFLSLYERLAGRRDGRSASDPTMERT